MKKPELDDKIKINPIVAYREIEGNVLFLLPDQQYLHTMNESGRFIWQRLTRGKAVTKIVRDLAAKYGIPLATAQRDVAGFLRGLAKLRIILTA